ncbi:arylesterase [Vulcaniibacterium thermophilum]|jgi:acyl-CoA thioesterase-1|uniref:Arylesterase n=1 Tax=Vulcaniibacterium thermophilum TaxID=1169913 RepID=A0A918Z3Z8_9GAMM|nr:arylesterase [Vulcaniibacterium thermophilum]GHE36292.1 arylesterase [Vulcaniibacterium thermophilum]
MSARYLANRTGLQWAIGWLLAAMLVALAVPVQAQSARAKPAPAPARTVLVMGDSLSAAYGLPARQGWVALTAERIARQHPGWKVVNASVSGETTAGGRSRIARELQRHRPALVVIALGANDGLRGLPLAQMKANLEAMVRAAKGSGARVLLLGMRLPPNYGRAYAQGFEEVYRQVARQHEVPLLPFLLEPIALNRDAFQSDNLHPTAAVQPRLRDHVWTALGPMLR